jgi:hypothetical protein
MRVGRMAPLWLNRVGLWLPLAAGVMAMSTGAAASLVGRPQEPADRSETVFVRVCTSCHTAESTVNLGRQPRAIWKSLIDQMVMEGTRGTDEDFALVEHYLLSRYGKVNVNQDGAEEILLVLALPRTQAEDIVRFRNVNGRFSGFDALVKVPGVDVKKLEHLRDAILF